MAWRDQSGNGNDLVQATPAAQPLADRGVANGLPAVHFDGTDDNLRFTTRLAGRVRTVFAVLSEDATAGTGARAVLGDATTADFYGGSPAWWYSINGSYWQTSPSIVSGQTWVNGAVVDGRTTARPRTLSVVCVQATAGVTADRLGGGMFGQWWKGHVAELLLYERPLTAAERKSVEDYLALRYAAYVGTAGAPEFTPNGGSFETSVAVTLSSPTPGARIHYTTDGSPPAQSSPLYDDSPFVLGATTTVRARSFRSGMNPSPVATASFTKQVEPSPRSVAGLAVWARGDAGLEVDSVGRVLAWRDQSGKGNDLVGTTPATGPLVDPEAANGLPAVRFDGADDNLRFTTRLAGTIRTVFAVVREDASAVVQSRSLLGDETTNDFYGGWPWWWYYGPPYVSTSASIVNGQTWVNGTAVNGRQTARPKTLSVLCVETTAGVTADRLGTGRYSNPWQGDVAELVVYERAAHERWSASRSKTTSR